MYSNMDHESKPFLSNDGDIDYAQAREKSESRPASFNASVILHLIFFLANFIALGIWIFIFLPETASKTCTLGSGVQEPFSPAQSALQYTVKTVDTHRKNSPYSGKPRPEVDQAWSRLLRGSMLTVTEDEMLRMNKTSIALTDGTGYVGYLEAFHMLHCVKRLYQSQYPEYYTDLAESGKLSTGHLEHCMEVLREGIMCNADVTVNTYRWDASSPDGLKGQNMYPRKCVDWSSLEEWADERAIGRHLERLVPDDEPLSMGPTELLS